MKTVKHITKVLPFDTEQGHVPGHELVSHQPEWMKSPVKQVVFETFSAKLGVKLEICIHWTEFTKYMKRAWPQGGSVVAVICADGRRIHCGSRSVNHYDAEAYLAAPIVCRDTFRVVSHSGTVLLEVAGVSEWAYSKRDAEATAKFLSCPWERDNAKYQADMAARQAGQFQPA